MRKKILTLMGWIAFIVAVLIAANMNDRYQSQRAQERAIKFLSEEMLNRMNTIDGAR